MEVTYLSRICLIFCGIIVLLSSVFAECPVGSIWNNRSQTCERCVDVCDLARGPDCLRRCLGTRLASGSIWSNRHRRDIFSRKCINVECPDFSYCDPGVGECTPCDQLCDHHRIQGTTELCGLKCPKYFSRLESTTPQAPHIEVPNRSTTIKPGATSTHSNERQDSEHNSLSDEFIIGIVIIIILISLAGIAALLWKRKYLAKRCCPTPEREEQKTSLPCSQEGDGELINSRTPLTGPRGPIAQERNFPKAESGNLTGDLGVEMGHPEICIPYTEVDGPGTHSTPPKTLC